MSRPPHIKSRGAYPGAPAEVKRFDVPDDKVAWSVAFPEYKPTDYTASVVAAKPVWADPEYRTDATAPPAKWHDVDGKIDRRSFEGKYEIENKVPKNIRGRTGMVGRGLLGKWGPNHAADPIVTRHAFFFSPCQRNIFCATIGLSTITHYCLPFEVRFSLCAFLEPSGLGHSGLMI